MANSTRYNKLSRRITVIESSYLPSVNSLGNYSSKEQDDIRAYLLLIHAEIESYFEEISEEKVKKAFLTWQENRKKSNVLLSLVSFSDVVLNQNEIETRVNKALTHYIAKIKINHGIKEKNILELLLPVGLEYQSLDTTWLNTMSSFGNIRGEVAHSASTVQQPLDPDTLKNTVKLILLEIKRLDELIKKLK
jgi:hypothetical protein